MFVVENPQSSSTTSSTSEPQKDENGYT